jgi:hypothetical protein
MLRASSKPRAEDGDVLALYIIGLYSLHLKDLDAKTRNAEPTPGDEGSMGVRFGCVPLPHNLTKFCHMLSA